jgi:hypothetical protein
VDTLHYRKIAQIAHRDGDPEIKAVAARYIPKVPGERGPEQFRKPDRRALRAWFEGWLGREIEPLIIMVIGA